MSKAGTSIGSGGILCVSGDDAVFRLASGRILDHVEIAYRSWGLMNAARSNVILVCHALTGDQCAGGPNPTTGRPAWWPRIIGPGKPLDTDRFCVIATNVLGGCMGSTGPASPGKGGAPALRARFPSITIADMVHAQIRFIDALGIPDILALIGGSMGGMQVLEWAARAPERVFAAIPVATAARQSAQNIGFYEVGRQAIMADTDWHDGDYHLHGTRPVRGLGVARMAAHITYMSEKNLKQRFDRAFQNPDTPNAGLGTEFQIESYLRYQGRSFVDRFDANSYLYLTRAMDNFDLASTHGKDRLASVFQDSPTRFCVFSFSSDWHYPPSESRNIVHALHAAGVDVSYLDIETDAGHDAFLLPSPEFEAALTDFVAALAEKRGLPPASGGTHI